jgi:hypothetical protein
MNVEAISLILMTTVSLTMVFAYVFTEPLARIYPHDYSVQHARSFRFRNATFEGDISDTFPGAATLRSDSMHPGNTSARAQRDADWAMHVAEHHACSAPCESDSILSRSELPWALEYVHSSIASEQGMFV